MFGRPKMKSGSSTTLSVVRLLVKYPARAPTYQRELATQSALADAVKFCRWSRMSKLPWGYVAPSSVGSTPSTLVGLQSTTARVRSDGRTCAV